MTIEELCEIDDELVLDILEESLGRMVKTFSKCPFPKTMEALLMLMINTNFMKTGIFRLCENDDPFSAAIIYRSIIEHFLRHNYLFLRFIEEKTDIPGIEFFELADIKEHFDYFRSEKSERQIFDEPDKDFDFNTYIFEKYPKYEELSREELKQKLSQFSVKVMVRFIWSRLGKMPQPAIINNLITDYSILSSYVHGGPHANRLMMFYSPNEDEREKEKLKLSTQGYFFSTYIKMNTWIAAGQYDNYFLGFVQKIREYALKTE